MISSKTSFIFPKSFLSSWPEGWRKQILQIVVRVGLGLRLQSLLTLNHLYLTRLKLAQAINGLVTVELYTDPGLIPAHGLPLEWPCAIVSIDERALFTAHFLQC